MTPDHAERVYALCLRFFVEARALGLTDVVISPGSRSAPLAISARRAGLRCTVQIDERAGAFHALGQAKVTGRPSLLVCSSGTAGANYLPAVIEAHHGQVPMIVCTADRPPELRRWGAGQTVEQMDFFGSATRWRYELPVASEIEEWLGRSVAQRALGEATGASPGPVHLNWPFREPLEPPPGLTAPLATLTAAVSGTHAGSDSGTLERLASEHERGVIVVGPGDRDRAEAEAIVAFGRRHGWPLVADPCAQIRTAGRADDAVITTGELLLGSPAFVDRLETEVVVRVGLAPTSKAYRQWVERDRPRSLVLVGPGTEWADPTHTFDHVVHGAVARAFAGDPTAGRGTTPWTRRWREAEHAARAVVERHIADDDGELGVAGAVAEVLPDGSTLVVSSSMPVRDLDLVLGSVSRRIRVVCNRGANGIDGVVSTATGAASVADGPTVLLIGDVAALHDIGGLAAAGRLRPDLTIVLIDNDGGGIFSFLPIARHGDDVWFTDLFTTPHGTDLHQVAAALGIDTRRSSRGTLAEDLTAAIKEGGPTLLQVDTDAIRHVSRFAALRAEVDHVLAERP